VAQDSGNIKIGILKLETLLLVEILNEFSMVYFLRIFLFEFVVVVVW